MKNIFRFLMAVAVLFTASCAKEDISSSIGGGEVEMTLTVDLPELGTRAFGNGENANILFYNIYEAGTENKLSDLCGSVESNTGVFNVHIVLLKGMQYDLVFWAQNKDCGYYTLNGKQVTAVYEGKNANDDVRDAFYNFIPNFNPANPETTSFALHRPFAQLNAAVKNSDIDAVEASDVVLTTSTVEVDTYTGFNIATGDVTGNKSTVTFVATAVPSTEVFRTGYTLLSMNYLLVPKAGMVSNAAFSFNAKKPSGDAFTFTGTSYNDVPLKQNYRTNILGSLLTKPTDFTVTIDAVFDVPDKDVVQTAAELQQQIENAPDGEETEIVLGGDIDLNDLLASLGTLSTRAAATLPIVIPAEKSIILDLNGCTINAPFEDENAGKHYYAFENRGTLTIKDTKGNGVINARGNFNYGTMTVESGTINATDGNGGYGVRNYEGATFTMNGGTIATTLEDDNQVDKGGYDATPLRVDEGATATINGGVIENICDYTYAVDNHGDLTIKGGEFTSIHSTIGNNGTMTIDGGSFTCNGLEGITAHCVVAWDGSTTTINGGTFDGKDNFNGFNVDADEGATVYIKGGLFKPVHSGSLYGNGNIVVSGGKFFDEIEDSRLADGCTLVQEGDYWVVNITPVAQIGETPYYTLEEAVDAVQNGETIQLLRNVTLTLTETLVIPTDKNISLDLNGKTLAHEDAVNKYALNNHGTLTIKGNGIVNARGIYNGYDADGNYVATAKLIIENGTFNAKGTNGGAAVFNYGTVEIKGGKFESNGGYGLNNQSAGVLSVANAEVNGGIYNKGNVTIENSTVYQHLSGKHAIYNWQGNVTINSGNFDSQSGNELIFADGTNASVVINDGTFNKTAKSWLYAAPANKGISFVIKGGNHNGYVNMPEGTVDPIRDYNPKEDVVIEGGIFNFNPTKWLAAGYKAVKNGETWTVYENIEANDASEFAAALAQGGVVTLGANITVSEPVVVSSGVTATIDLNGKTVTAVEYAFENSGNLSIEGDGVVNGIVYNANGGEIAINGGTYNVVDGGKWVLLNDGGKLTINAATINGGSSYPIYSYGANANLVINDATVNATFGCINSYGTGNTVEINGGTYNMTGVQGKTSHIAYFSNVDAVINGGTFQKIGDINMSAAGGGGICVIYGAKLTIEGGNFAGDYADVYDWGGTNANGRANSTSIKGGTYKFKPSFVAEGYKASQNTNGTWTVSK